MLNPAGSATVYWHDGAVLSGSLLQQLRLRFNFSSFGHFIFLFVCDFPIIYIIERGPLATLCLESFLMVQLILFSLFVMKD